MNRPATTTAIPAFKVRRALYWRCSGWTELRSWPAGGGAVWTRWHTLGNASDGEQAWGDDCATQNNADRQLFWGVCTRRPQDGDVSKWKGGAEQCLEWPAAWVDLDFAKNVSDAELRASEADARARLAAFDVAPPSIVIHSGHGLHAYWLLTVPCPLPTPEDRARAERINRGLTAILQGDPKACDIAHIMRVPGSMNRKDPAKPVPVRVESFNANQRYTVAELEALIAVVDEPAPPVWPTRGVLVAQASTVPTAPGRPDVATRVADYVATWEPAIEGQGGDAYTYSKVCALVIDFALSDDEVLQALQPWNATCQPPWTERELVQKIASARKYAKGQPGRLLNQPPPRTQQATKDVPPAVRPSPAPPTAPAATGAAIAVAPKRLPPAAPEPRPRGRRGPAEDDAGFIRTDNGQGNIVASNPDNVRNAIVLLGLKPTFDLFRQQILLNGEPITDLAVDVTWGRIYSAFKFKVDIDLLRRVITVEAMQYQRHPVCEYLAALRWDGTPRLDRWLVTYGGAKDTPYVRAVGALPLLAAVRRVREPGAKFDELLILESKQGLNKSTAMRALCPRDAWFSDSLPLGIDAKETIERTAGRWIIEAAELHGKRGREVEQLKAFLSRPVDGPARPAWGRFAVTAPRQFVIIGTTNARTAYLKDPTGARRFWPVTVKTFNVAALTADRDQLWAEAAQREAAGVSIRLDKDLYAVAGVEQDNRRATDPWEDILAPLLEGDGITKPTSIAVDAIWTALEVKACFQDNSAADRVSAILQRYGFTKGRPYVNGKQIRAWVPVDDDDDELSV